MNRSDATKQSLGAPLASLIRAEKVRLAYGHLPLALLATVANALAVVILLWHRQTPHAMLLSWLSLILLLSAVRHAHFLSYRRQANTEALDTVDNRFRYGALAAGVLWGSIALFPEQTLVYQAMLAIVLVGMSAGASITLSSHRDILQAFLLLALLPMIVRLALVGEALPLMLSAMGTLFLVMISAAARMFHHNVIDGIRLRLEAQQREQVLKQTENQYRYLFEMANDAILIVDLRGTILNANTVAYTRLGYDRQEFLGMDITELLSPKFAANRQARAEQILAHGSLSFEAEHACKDGRLIPVEVNARRIDYHGQEAVLSIARDISDRKRVEERLRTLSRALEQAGESIIITDHDGRIEYTNPAFTTMTGYSPDEAWGEDLRLLKMKDGRRGTRLYRQMWSTARSGEVWQQKLTGCGKDGRYIPMFMSFSPIVDDDGRISHFVAIQQDITEHVELEDQLRQAQKMEAIGTLVGGIAHDFNNVLTGITGNLFLAKRQTGHMPEVTEKLELSEKLAFSASSMVRHLLTFARKDAVEIQPMDLSRFMQETNRLYELSMPGHIAYHSEISEQELPVRGDDTQLQQVIINLLNNARDAVNETESPRVTIKLESFNAPAQFRHRHHTTTRHFARISIEDNGPGIPEDIKARIFEPFFTTKKAGQGTGLGLAMVYGTITSHGGLIDVESAPGSGTAFHIYLPLQPQLNLELPTARDSELPVIGQGETLLVVDDDPQVLEITSHILEALGYRVLTAADGEEAIRIFNRHADRIKLIIMDLVMPRLGGARAYERLHHLHEDVRVIFITSHDLKQRLEIDPLQDEAIVLQKPCSATQLSQSVRHALERTLH